MDDQTDLNPKSKLNEEDYAFSRDDSDSDISVCL